ncbi:MAG TPA: efflux RND transporter permease subunit [Gemmataceae bacterium]|nr:efflux RND transporter permease subunit [Gemmataceae bacterium]
MFNLASRVRPYFGALVLSFCLLTAGGIYSAVRMPSGVYPEVTFPRISVVAKVPAMAVANIDVLVTQPLEQELSGVPGVAQVRSKTIRGGSEMSLEFSPGTDMRIAESQTWNRIGAIRSTLPPETDLRVEQMTPSVFPIMSVVLTGGDNSSDLRDYAFFQLAPLIKNIPDVLQANVAGGNIREIIVEARPGDLLQHGLSAADLADQIGKAHRMQPIGRSERPPLAYQLVINNQGETARSIEELIISTNGNQPLLVRDVADVKVLHQDRVQSIGFAGRDAVVITVFRRLGGNTVNISRDIQDLLKKYRLPANIQANVVYDQANFVNTAVENVRDAIVIGGLFSILILFAFLRSWRATLISALAIPTTLAITFLFMRLSGETLNLMSLGGLAVAIGLIIDDTVVVIENIGRHLAPAPTGGAGAPPLDGHGAPAGAAGSVVHQPPRDPVDAASGEITGAVVGSTLTTVLVFVPLAFIVGVYGQFFAALSWSLSIAVLVSMVISLTLIPVFAAKFLEGRPMPGPGPIYQYFADVYEKMLDGALRFPRLTLGLSVAAVGVGVVLFTGIPNMHETQEPGKPPSAPYFKGIQTGLMPEMDEGAFVVDYWAPSGTPLTETENMARTVEEILSKNPDVEAYVRRTGAELGMFATQTSRGDIQVVLRPAQDDPLSLLIKPVRPGFTDPVPGHGKKTLEEMIKEWGTEAAEKKYGAKLTKADPKERQRLIWDEGKTVVRQKYRRPPMNKVMAEIEDEIKDNFHEHQFRVEMVQIMQDELNDLSGANKAVEVKLFGPDHTELRRLADGPIGEMLEKKGKGRGIKGVNTNVHEGNPDLMIALDGVQAAKRGLTNDAVERQLKVMFFGQVATQVRESAARITNVRVRYPDSARFGRSDFDPYFTLNDLWLLLPVTALTPTTLPDRDRTVPLTSIAKFTRKRTPDEQYRENQQPAIFVTAEQNEDEAGLGSIVADIQNWMGSVNLPPGYRWEMGGHYLHQRAAFKSLLLVMVVAVILVFIMLAFQFQSVVLPMLIFLTQPLSLVSGLLALRLTGTPLNVSSYMGAILLIGLDMKNGILLVEYIQQLLGQGMELRPALLLAGRTRFRPILMTSLAAILGLLPLAMGIGPGAQMQQPLAIMVIGGLTANMLFTRLVIPVGYLVLEGKKHIMSADREKHPLTLPTT